MGNNNGDNRKPHIPPASESSDTSDDLDFDLYESTVEYDEISDDSIEALADDATQGELVIDEELEREVGQWLSASEKSKPAPADLPVSRDKPPRGRQVPDVEEAKSDDWSDVLSGLTADVKPDQEKTAEEASSERGAKSKSPQPSADQAKDKRRSRTGNDAPVVSTKPAGDPQPKDASSKSPKSLDGKSSREHRARSNPPPVDDLSGDFELAPALPEAEIERTTETRLRSRDAAGPKPSVATDKPNVATTPKADSRSHAKSTEQTGRSRTAHGDTNRVRADSAADSLDAINTDPFADSPLDRLAEDPGYDIVAGPDADLTRPAADASPASAKPAAEKGRLQSMVGAWQRAAAWKKLLIVTIPTVVLLGLGTVFYQSRMQGDEQPDYPPRPKRPLSAKPATDAAPPNPATPQVAGPTAAASVPVAPPAVDIDRVTEIGIAYGTEKRSWLEWAAKEFSTTEAGRKIRVQLIPFGSLESAHAILDGDKRLHVWAPASSLYRESFLRDWEAKYGGNPIVKEEPLALTPMVIAMWKSRFEAFAKKSPEISLRTVRFAMRAPRGWATIADKPMWGRFKFAYTHPNQSNSGLMTLLVLAYEFYGKTSGLTVSDIMQPEFQDHLSTFATAVNNVSNSTGNMMREMTLKGPTNCDAAIVYESVAIEYIERAEGRWDRLQIIYPRQNLWNDNPYCILNTKWTSPETQQAAETFLKFLLSEPAQLKALDFGFRPANASVSIKGPDSPFTKYVDNGISIDLPEMCEVPSRDVMENLLQSWIRSSREGG
jgi:hypothetical protein